MFNQCAKLEDVSNVIIDGINGDSASRVTSGMFAGCTNLNLSTFRPLNQFNYLYTSSMFSGCVNINDNQLIDFIKNNTSRFALLTSTLANTGITQPLDVKNISKVYYSSMNISWLYSSCRNIVSVNLDTMMLSSGNAYNLFTSCTNLKTITSTSYMSIPNANGMFSDCVNLTEATVGLVNQNAGYMFANCISLKTATILENSVSNGRQTMRYMFANCQNLETLNAPDWFWSGKSAEGWNIHNGANYLFYNCSKLNYSKPINMIVNSGSIDCMFLNCRNVTSDINMYYKADLGFYNNVSQAFTNIGSSNISIEVVSINSGVYVSSLAAGCSNLKHIAVIANTTKALSSFAGYNMLYNIQNLETVSLNVPANITSSIYANPCVSNCNIKNSVNIDFGNCVPNQINLATVISYCKGNFDINITNIHLKAGGYINMWGIVHSCPDVQNINIDLSNVTSNIGPLVIYNCPNISDTTMDNIIGQIANHTFWSNSTSSYNLGGNLYISRIFTNCNISGDRLNNLPNTAKLVAKGWKVNI